LPTRCGRFRESGVATTIATSRPNDALFAAWPDRFVVGSDTWTNERWARYGDIIAAYRGWLAELPPPAAAKIARENGERLFPQRARR
jgi:predicted TIM-barrel fold metal-dependent hydrolase